MIVHCEKGTKKIMNDVEREKLKNIIEESNNKQCHQKHNA